MPFLSFFKKPVVLALAVLLPLVFFSYQPVLKNELLNWMDPAAITANPQVRGAESLKFFAPAPLTTATFILENRTSSLNPFNIHLNNLLLHLAAVLCVFFLSLRLGLNPLGALLAAFLFAWHPMQIEAAASASGRMHVLGALFYFLSLICYYRYLTGNFFWLVPVFVTALMGYFSSVACVSLPLMFCLMDWHLQRGNGVRSIINKWPLVIPAVVVAWLNWPSLTNPWHLAFLIKQWWVPLKPLVFYPEPSLKLTSMSLWGALAILAASLGIMFFLRKDRAVLLGGGIFFISALFIVYLPGPQGIANAASYHLYLPSFGFCLLFAYAMERLYGFLKSQEKVIRILFIIGLSALVLGLAFSAHAQSGIWKNNLSLWQYQAKHFPHPEAFYRLAEAYEARNDHANAQAHYQKAIELNPKYSKAYDKIAEFHLRKGKRDLAVEWYQKSIEANPKESAPYLGLGLIYQAMNNAPEAISIYNELIKNIPDDEDAYMRTIEAYGKAIERDPGNVLYQEKREELLAAFEQFSKRKRYNAVDYYNLGFLYHQVGGREEALRFYKKALDLQPNYPQALFNLGSIYEQSGEFKSALEIYSRLVHIDPKNVQAYLRMGIIMNALGENQKAHQLYQRVIKMDPEYSKAYFHLGYLSESAGELREAIDYYEKAIETDAKNSEAYYNLGNVYATLGQTGEAIALYLKTVGLDPNHQNAFVNLSVLSFKSRDFKGAIRYLEHAQNLGYNAPAEYLKTLEPYRSK